MKIAFIFSQFPCYDETFILREMNQLKATGLRFVIYSLKTPKDKIIHGEAKDLAAEASYLPFVSWRLLSIDLFFCFRHPGRYLSAFFGTFFRLLKSPGFFFKTGFLWYKAVGFAWLARKQGITHVHGEWATYPATLAYIISRLNNIPFSFTGHAHDIYVDTTLLAFKMRRAKFVVTCTQDNRRYLLSVAKATKIVVSYHGVNLEKFRRKVSTFQGINVSRKFKILSVGSLLECKGFEYLIEACNILKEKGLEFECVIAGGGRLEQGLRLQVASRGLQEQIKITGYITQEELIPIYKEADVFVLAMVPEIHWGIANVLIEAAAASLPIVCTMLPSIPELIEDGKTGFIIPAADPAAIAVVVEKLYKDEGLRRRIGEAGRGVIEEKFDVVKNAQRLKELFV